MLSTKDLGKLLGKPWRSISTNVLTTEFKRAIGALGWTYVPGKGRKGSRFECNEYQQIDHSLVPLDVPEEATVHQGSELSDPMLTGGSAQECHRLECSECPEERPLTGVSLH